jgi:hypothetical protein
MSCLEGPAEHIHPLPWLVLTQIFVRQSLEMQVLLTRRETLDWKNPVKALRTCLRQRPDEILTPVWMDVQFLSPFEGRGPPDVGVLSTNLGKDEPSLGRGGS